MKKLKLLFAVAAVLLLCSLFNGVLASNTEGPVYRLYSPVTGEHLYTMDDNEKSSLVGVGWRDEGVAFYAWSYYIYSLGNSEDLYPIFRLNNDRLRLHLYTSDQNEVNSLQQQGWTVDGNGVGCFYTFPSCECPIYRLYNPRNGQHLLTGDINEYNALPASGWRQEGPKFNVYGLN